MIIGLGMTADAQITTFVSATGEKCFELKRDTIEGDNVIVRTYLVDCNLSTADYQALILYPFLTPAEKTEYNIYWLTSNRCINADIVKPGQTTPLIIMFAPPPEK